MEFDRFVEKLAHRSDLPKAERWCVDGTLAPIESARQPKKVAHGLERERFIATREHGFA